MLKCIRIIGIGIGMALQQNVRLDPTVYYMPYIPISLNESMLVILNVGILIVSYLTLLNACHFISTTKPTATMRFE